MLPNALRILALLLAACVARAGSPPTLRIGVLAHQGPAEAVRRWQPLADYLTGRIASYRFLIVPLTAEEVLPAARDKKVDYLIPTNSQEVSLEVRYGAVPLATLVAEHRHNVPTDRMGGVVFCRASHSGIHSWTDLLGRRVAIFRAGSFAWLAARREMLRRSIKPENFAAILERQGSVDEVVYAVRDGDADAGIVSTGTLERMDEEGKIRLSDYRSLPFDSPQPEEPGFPFLLSTRLYPENPFVRLSHAPSVLSRRLIVELLRIREEAPSARPSHVAGWTPPADYTPLHECLKELDEPPYSTDPEFLLRVTIRRYWPLFAACAAAGVLLTGGGLLVLRLNRKLQRAYVETRQALLRSEFTRFAVEHAAEVILIADKAGKVVAANRAASDHLGYSQDELIGLTVDRIDPSLCPERWRAYWNKLRHRGSFSFETHQRRKNGQHVPVEIRSTFLKYQGGEYNFAFVRDISERLELERESKASEQQLRMVWARSLDGMRLTDAGGTVLRVNDAFCRMVEKTREEMEQHEFTIIYVPDTRERSLAQYRRRVLEGTLIPRIEREVRLWNGKQLTLDLSISPFETAAGTVVLSIFRDVTARREAEERVQRALAHAESASRAKSDFLANMSHEIRTPMNGVLGMLELLLTTPLNTDQRDCLETAQSAARSLLSLLNDILDLSKIEAGQLDLASAPFNPRDAVRGAIEVVEPAARDKGVLLNWSATPDLPEIVEGDPLRFRQVLLNLIGNAVKFTDVGSVDVTVRLLTRQGGSLRVGCTVEDTGIGIPANQQSAIFEAFHQADGSVSRLYGGSGLGLTISRRLVRLMGGGISVQSTPGQGSRFDFSVRFGLPRTESRPEQNRPSTTDTCPPLRILVAEDNPINQKVLVKLLGRDGHQADVAADGEAALAALQKGAYDIVLMDVQMPGLDGLEVTRRFRLMENGGPRLPIIALTAHAMRGDAERCFAAGMDAYLSKPVDASALRAVLARWANPGACEIASRSNRESSPQIPPVPPPAATTH